MGLAVSSAASQCQPVFVAVNERIYVLTLQAAITPLILVQVYAPTDSAAPGAEAKDTFYKQLQHQPDQIPNANMLCLMGNFNAMLGCQAEQWGSVIGRGD